MKQASLLPWGAIVIVYILFFFLSVSVRSELPQPVSGRDWPGEKRTDAWSTPWVDSVFHSLSLEQRIAQLFMIQLDSDRGSANERHALRLISRYQPGGIIFAKGGPQRQLALTRKLQQAASVPLLIAMDAEWGPAMRLDSIMPLPRPISLGAITDDELVYQAGREAGRQLRLLEVHMNFAPVADVNANPENPVIGFRSFGESAENVSNKSIAFMRGLHDAGILACAKHFPGHGDTAEDSHHVLPLISHSREHLDSLHILPFSRLTDAGLEAVMPAHLHIPALDSRPGIPSSLSDRVVTDLLQHELGFKGLIVTDGLHMKGVSGYAREGEIERLALLAGNDILLMPRDLSRSVHALKEAVEQGRLPEDIINRACRKILYYKEKYIPEKPETYDKTELAARLQTPYTELLQRELAAASVTLLKKSDDLFPLAPALIAQTASLSLGGGPTSVFPQRLYRDHEIEGYFLNKNPGASEQDAMLKQLARYPHIIVSVHQNSFYPGRRFGMTTQMADFLERLSHQTRLSLVVFAPPWSLGYLGSVIERADNILLAYEEEVNFSHAAADVMAGYVPARGRLPVTLPPYFPLYHSAADPAYQGIRLIHPKDLGIDPFELWTIDSLALEGINQQAFPGCQILLMQHGRVFYHKAFGYHRYDQPLDVRLTDIYDLASLTKILSGTAALMHLFEQGRFDPARQISDYLPRLKSSQAGSLRMRDVLAHQARFPGWIPFFADFMPEGFPSEALFSRDISAAHPVEVSPGLFGHYSLMDSIIDRISAIELRKQPGYHYSDLGFILLTEMIRQSEGVSLDHLTDSLFFRPNGLHTLGYSPLARFPSRRIVPSEVDTVYRRAELHGFVNDPTAALMGGVSGHAGLFGNAEDVAKMMQQFLGGRPEEKQGIFRHETLRVFTSYAFPGTENRRGLGFDKPEKKFRQNGPACQSASAGSFGHSGFTGTYAWADPENQLVFVFLSNRTWPSATNRKLIEMNLRTRIHQRVYDILNQSKP